MRAISLFSGAGIGDIGLRAAGFDFLGFSELEGDRLELIKKNFPNAKYFVGDIWETQEEIIKEFQGQDIKLVTCTAPCQGMSKNGQGTLLKNIREGKRPRLDPRNRLIIPALNVITNINPEFVIFENVPEMRRTYIEDDSGEIVTILDYVESRLGVKYVGKAYDVEFANYGIAQRRQRLITIYSRNKNHATLMRSGHDLIPSETHSKNGDGGKRKWVSVTEAISDFPALDARSRAAATYPSIKFHKVPVLDESKYFWVSNTPVGRSAFDNQCISCGFNGNPTHSTGRNSLGINSSSKETPIYCQKCNSLLPRPAVKNDDGTLRIMSGFTSAYKRMSPDLPSPTLTRNFSYACSDSKIHPYQNRVISIAEALRIHTLEDYGYSWIRKSDSGEIPATDGLVRLVIGESIPPKFMELLGRHLIETSCMEFIPSAKAVEQFDLFSN